MSNVEKLTPTPEAIMAIMAYLPECNKRMLGRPLQDAVATVAKAEAHLAEAKANLNAACGRARKRIASGWTEDEIAEAGRRLVAEQAGDCRRRSGFTLVELLVVIAIIAALIAILIPALKGSREAARQVKCVANLKSLGTAAYQYTDVYRTFPPDDLEALDLPDAVYRCPSDYITPTGPGWSSFNWRPPVYYFNINVPPPFPPISPALALERYYNHNDELLLFSERQWENHKRYRSRINFGLKIDRKVR